MKKTLRNIGAGIMAGAVSLLPMKDANAQINGSLDIVKSSEPKKSYVRPCLSYELPANIKGFTFLEFYQKGNEEGGKTYFGRTKLTKEVFKRFGLRADATHGSESPNTYGLGLNVTIPNKTIFANLYLTPFWVNGKLNKVENKTLAGYFASTKLPFGLELSSFGELNLNAKGGAQWTYGELNLEKKFGKEKNFSVAYNPALKNKGGPIPKLEHRVTARYYFK